MRFQLETVYYLAFQISQKRFRLAAMLFVFTISAVVHEYILAVCFGFFYPVLFCLFMCFGSKKNDWRNRASLPLSHKTPESLSFCLHFIPSDVQLHPAWPTERPHLERHHVDGSVPGSGRDHLSVLPGVVRSEILSCEGGNNMTCSEVLASRRKDASWREDVSVSAVFSGVGYSSVLELSNGLKDRLKSFDSTGIIVRRSASPDHWRVSVNLNIYGFFLSLH